MLTVQIVRALRDRLRAGRLFEHALILSIAAALLLALGYGVAIGAAKGSVPGVRMGLIAGGVNLILIGVGLVAAWTGKSGTRAGLAYAWLRSLPWAATPLMLTYAFALPIAIGHRLNFPAFHFIGAIVEIIAVLAFPVWGLVWCGAWDLGSRRAGLLMDDPPMRAQVSFLVALLLAVCGGAVGMLLVVMAHT